MGYAINTHFYACPPPIGAPDWISRQTRSRQSDRQGPVLNLGPDGESHDPATGPGGGVQPHWRTTHDEVHSDGLPDTA